jgi:hypothetical protein
MSQHLYASAIGVVNFRIESPGTCYTCSHFGRHKGTVYVWCIRPGFHHVVGQPLTGCSFWVREPGSDDEPCKPEERY